jgi:hypothetical protein
MALVLTPTEAAVQLWQSDTTRVVDQDGQLLPTYKNRIYAWIKSDSIKSIKVGSRYFIPQSALEELT